MPAFTLTPAILAAIAGAILSLAFSYVPGLNTWYASKDEEVKKLIMALLLLILSAGLFGLQCAGILEAGLSCDQQGAIQLTWIFLAAIVANQSVYKITPQLEKVKDAKFGWNDETTSPPVE